MKLKPINEYVDNFDELNKKEKFYEIIEPDEFKCNFLDKYIGNIFILCKLYVNQTHKNNEFIDFNQNYNSLIMLSIMNLFDMMYDKETNQVTDYERLFQELCSLLKRFNETIPGDLKETLRILGYSDEIIDVVIRGLESS